MINSVMIQAGGKRRLAEAIFELFPKDFKNFYEPFCGTAYITLNVKGHPRIMSDLNQSLMSVWNCIKFTPIKFMEVCDQIETIGDYYAIRKSYNDAILAHDFDIETSAKYLYLAKHCFNGQVRSNRKGLFNQAKGRSTNMTYNREDILKVSAVLQNIEMACTDYRVMTSQCKAGDFVFLDPPYESICKSPTLKYLAQTFILDDFAEVCYDLDKRGVLLMICNYPTLEVMEKFKMFNAHQVDNLSLMCADKRRRGKVTEVLFTNY